MTSIDLLPDDAESLKRLLLAREEELVTARAGQAAAEAEVAHALAQVSSAEAMIVPHSVERAPPPTTTSRSTCEPAARSVASPSA